MRSCVKFILFMVLSVAMLTFFPKITFAFDSTLLYTLDPAGTVQNLIGIDPDDGVVKFKLPLTGSYKNFRSNTLAFKKNNELYGIDNTNSKLFTVNTSTGGVSVVGSLAAAYTWIGGIAFDSLGNLYGIHSGTDELYSLSTAPDTTGNIVVTSIGSLGIDAQNHGMAVKFNENKFYGLTANTNIYDSVFTIDKTLTTAYSDNFQTNTYNNYTWVQNADPSYRPGTYASYVAPTQTTPGYMWMDGIYNGNLCCWIPANIDAEKTMNIPKSGQAVIYFDIARNGEGQSRIYLKLIQDGNNYYSFVVTDITYGSSGYTQGVRKTVNGTPYSIMAPGTVYNPGAYKMVAYWSPENLRLRITNLSAGVTTEHNYYPGNKTVLNPTKLVFGAYRFEAKWKSIQVSPGLAKVVGSLGVQAAGVGVEFNPNPALPDELCAIRNNNQLYKYDVNTKVVTGPFMIVNDSGTVNTVNLAAPWPE